MASPVSPAYDGPDKQYFTDVAKPTRKDGQSFKVGFLQISGAQPVLVAKQEEVEAVRCCSWQYSETDSHPTPTQNATPGTSAIED